MKNINHKIIEKNRNQKWINKKYFSNHDLSKKPFTIILPPPNVTGKLHLGHAWDAFIQDVIIRYKKLKGFDVLFLPGVDHAGIATQIKVEERLREQNIFKQDLGRDKFLEQIWSWKDEYYNIIKQQWHSLGIALDYESERFTLDDLSNKAVLKVFIDLYNKNIIYRAKKAINWDPKQQTTLSNMEVNNKAVEQKMYYIKYELKNQPNNFLIVGTTRIETIPSDVALCVNPNDERYKHLINQEVIHPFTKKIIPIISDEYIDMNFASGVMKVSAHSIVDIDIINKNNLEIHESITKDGKMNSLALEFEGLDRFEARKEFYKKLEKENLIDKVENVISNVGFSERSNEIIEILVFDQWFIDMKPLSQKLETHLNSKQAVSFLPTRFKKVLKKWSENAYDWNISRQLWWGHRIPAWYKNGKMKVQVESPGKDWKQDEDVLDTWFSSGLAPFSFLGWPENNTKTSRYFPTSLLVTGWDIIFFWVLRMYIFGLEVMNDKPFNQVLLHGLIRDEQGRKMSKSLNNGIDPMDIIDNYGSDVLRESLIFHSTPGQDIKFSNDKLEAAWNFNNKIWNIANFIKQMKDETTSIQDRDKWILNQIYKLNKTIDKHMKKYEFTLIYKEIYKFIFDDLSSWYIEFSKIEPSQKQALNIFKKVLIILHPFIPFLTDYLYEELYNEELLETQKINLKSYKDIVYIDEVIEIVQNLRQYREKYSISKKIRLEYCIKNKNINSKAIQMINKLINGEYKENNTAFYKTNNFEIFINLNSEFLKKQVENQQKEIEKIKFEIERAKNLLSNSNFLTKAPKEKVLIEKKKLFEYEQKLKSYTKK
ncbi:valine--tRNA ligase [Mesomycoplasma neurolyticum]|uniref:Valine--tRNA ligase n=1 Tax=Mesomycoplasma neurolyticum TaxID=2120 RepID=A0A449A5V9_9BACT|nr:valine--tRNA ligase [Mesomycoplasma neurolyticum]VEU59614.1 Valine--tRNA ligase [Mesomycoplasma neurolyticum]